jgi:hypothetical protein
MMHDISREALSTADELSRGSEALFALDQGSETVSRLSVCFVFCVCCLLSPARRVVLHEVKCPTRRVGGRRSCNIGFIMCGKLKHVG